MQQGNLTDISNLPESQNRVKPQDTKLEQPSSQRSTMQSFGDVPAGGQENVTLNDQGQPGSLENLAGEQEKTGISGFIQKTYAQVQGFIQKTTGLGAAEAQDIKQGIQKRAYLKRTSVRRTLRKPAQARTFQNYMGSYRRNLRRQGRRLAQLRWRARGVISQAFQRQGEQLPQQYSEDPKKFVLNFNANQWNNESGFKGGRRFQKQQAQAPIDTDPRQYVLQYSAHDWNDMSNLNVQQRATYYMARAQNFLKDTSRNLSNWNLQRNTRRFKNQAQKKRAQIQRQLKEKIPKAQ